MSIINIAGLVKGIGSATSKVIETVKPNATVKLSKEMEFATQGLALKEKLMSRLVFNLTSFLLVFTFLVKFLEVTWAHYFVILGWLSVDDMDLIYKSANVIGVPTIIAFLIQFIGQTVFKLKSNRETTKAINEQIEAIRLRGLEEKKNKDNVVKRDLVNWDKVGELELGSKKPRVNWKWIKKIEGGSINKGYVPYDTNGTAGVTIGAGIDLGHLDVNETRLDKTTFPDIYSKIAPYLGLRGKKAKAFLKKNPLILSPDYVKVINDNVRRHFFEEVCREYKEENDDFLSLPGPAQTVVMSRAWHGHWDLSKRCPVFFGHTLNRDWISASKELRNFYPDKEQMKAFGDRLNKEADLILKSIKA